MSKIKLKLILLFLFVTPMLCSVQADESHSAVVDKLGREAINTLTNPSSDLAEIESKFLVLLTRDFAVKDIAQFVLGRYWRTTNEEQRSRFVSIFQDRLKKAYASRFKEFSGVNFKVKNSRQEADYGVVSSTIQKAGGPEVSVDWWVKGGKIHDVVVSGVSMRSTLRDDYNSLVSQHNSQIDNFLNDLEKRS